MALKKCIISAGSQVVSLPLRANDPRVADSTGALAAAVFNARVIPSVAYTDPEVAWVGLTEDQAKAHGHGKILGGGGGGARQLYRCAAGAQVDFVAAIAQYNTSVLARRANL